MAEKYGIYKCEKCGNIVQVLHGEEPSIICCGQDMTKLVANTVDAAQEKHVPVVEEIEGGYLVRVGSVDHPMTPEHYIQWIDLITEDGTLIQRKFLDPSDAPKATFKTEADKVVAREYCNLHGLWEK